MDQDHDMEAKGTWADDVESDLTEQEITLEKQNEIESLTEHSEEKLPDTPTEIAHGPPSVEGFWEKIITRIGNLAIKPPTPVMPNVELPASQPHPEPRPSPQTQASDFVPGGLILFLPEKLRIRLDPSRGLELKLTDNPPAPPLYEKPRYGELKVGLTVDDYDTSTSASGSGNTERNYRVNIPVYLTASKNRDLVYQDSNRRLVPEEYIYFDRRYREAAVRKLAHASLLNEYDLKLKHAEETHITRLREWRIIRRYKEHAIVEGEWTGGNHSIFQAGVTKEDIEAAFQYIQDQNQLDMEGKIDDWFNGVPSTREDLEDGTGKGLDTNTKPNRVVDNKAKPTGRKINSYADAVVKGTREPSKFELNAQKQRAIAEWKKLKKEHRKQNRITKTRNEIKREKRDAIIVKRDKGIVPEHPCPLCKKSGHWKVDCPGQNPKEENAKEQSSKEESPKEEQSKQKSANKPEINKVKDKTKTKNKKKQPVKIQVPHVQIQIGGVDALPSNGKGSKKKQSVIVTRFGSSITGGA